MDGQDKQDKEKNHPVHPVYPCSKRKQTLTWMDRIKKKIKTSCSSRLSLFKKKTDINMDGQDKQDKNLFVYIPFIPVP